MTRRPVLPACAFLVSCLVAIAGSAFASETETMTSVTGEYLYNLEEEASVFDARVELDIVNDPVTIGAVFRAYQLSNPDYNPAEIEVPKAELKRRFAEFRRDELFVRAGHFSTTFGRGIALRSFEEIELEYDTFLDGLLVEYGGGWGDLTVLSGIAAEPLFGTRHRDHTIRALRASSDLGDRLAVGAHAVERSEVTWDEEIETLPDELARYDDAVFGGDATAWLGPMTLSGEYALREGENPLTGLGAVSGRATYLSGTLELPWLTLFGEYKDYWDFAHRLMSPPTCVREHLWTMMNRATYEIDADDEAGFLIEGSAPIGETASMSGGASEARDHDGELKHWEIFGQADHRISERLTGSVGGSWSREYTQGKFTERRIAACELDVLLAGDAGLDVTFEAGQVEEPGGGTFEDYLVSAAWYPTADLTVSSLAEATTEKGLASDTWISFEVRKLVAYDLEISVSAGTERGGKTCSGGVCYVEPPFEGVRLRMTAYF